MVHIKHVLFHLYTTPIHNKTTQNPKKFIIQVVRCQKKKKNRKNNDQYKTTLMFSLIHGLPITFDITTESPDTDIGQYQDK